MSPDVQKFCDAFKLSREMLEFKPSPENSNEVAEEDRHLKELFERKRSQLLTLRYPIDGVPRPEPHAYPGLRPFRPLEMEIFFGRVAEAEALRRRLSESQTVIVLGGSGSGKSSLVLAGVLPLLNRKPVEARTGRWYYAVFRPGDRPIEQIRHALAEPLKKLLLLEKGRAALRQFRDRDLQEPLERSLANSVARRKQFLSGNLRLFLKTYITDKIIDASAAIENARQSTADIILSRIFSYWCPGDGSAETEEGATGLIDAVATFIIFLEEIDSIFDDLNDSYRVGAINFLLLADQFEEFFRPVTIDKVSNDPKNARKRREVEQFVRLMQWTKSDESKTSSKLIIVGTLRSEELHRCAEFEGLAEIVNNGSYLLDRPSRDELKAATVEPARLILDGWDVPYQNDSRDEPFDTTFLQKIIADDQHKSQVDLFQINSFRKYASSDKLTDRHQADLLPLFQHLLRITWRTAILRWDQEKPNLATVEYERDISTWLRDREGVALRVLGHLTQAVDKATERSKQLELPDNILEKCFDIALTITIAESVIFDTLDDGRLDDIPKLNSEIENWIGDSSRPNLQRERLNLIRATFVCLARKDDKGNLARNPTHASTILSAASLANTPENEVLLNKTLKLLRIRNYIAFVKDRKYDIGHEAMIRNSSLYRYWIDQADEIEAALYTARMLVKREAHSGISLQEMEASNNVFSPKDIYERLMLIFDPEAKILSPEWLKSRVGESSAEQERLGEASIENIEHVWNNVRRWRLDVGSDWKPKTWSEVFAAKLKRSPHVPGAEISAMNRKIKTFTRRLGYGLILVLVGSAGLFSYLFMASSAERDALRVIAVVSDQAARPPGRDTEFVKPILKGSARKIKNIEDLVDPETLSLARGGFNTAARKLFGASYLVDVRKDWNKSVGWESLSCNFLKPRSNGLAPPSFQSVDHKRTLEYSESERRYLLKFNHEDAEIRQTDGKPSSYPLYPLPDDVDGFLCASPTLDYFVLWTNPKNSLPAVFPVYWLKIGSVEKGVIGEQPWPAVAPPEPLMKALADLSNNITAVEARVLFRRPWYFVTMKVHATGDNYIDLRFARGALEPEAARSRPSSKDLDDAVCKPSSTSDEIFNCGNDINIQLISSPIAPEGKAVQNCQLCRNKVIIQKFHKNRNIILAATPDFKSKRITKVSQIGETIFLTSNNWEKSEEVLKIDYAIDSILSDLDDLPQASYTDKNILDAFKENKTRSTCDTFECLEWESDSKAIPAEFMARIAALLSRVKASFNKE